MFCLYILWFQCKIWRSMLLPVFGYFQSILIWRGFGRGDDGLRFDLSFKRRWHALRLRLKRRKMFKCKKVGKKMKPKGYRSGQKSRTKTTTDLFKLLALFGFTLLLGSWRSFLFITVISSLSFSRSETHTGCFLLQLIPCSEVKVNNFWN